jgi:hypothetical protein
MLELELAYERINRRLAEAEHDRLVRALRGPRAGAGHHAARLAGGLLIRLGDGLLRLSRVDDAAPAAARRHSAV